MRQPVRGHGLRLVVSLSLLSLSSADQNQSGAPGARRGRLNSNGFGRSVLSVLGVSQDCFTFQLPLAFFTLAPARCIMFIRGMETFGINVTYLAAVKCKMFDIETQQH